MDGGTFSLGHKKPSREKSKQGEGGWLRMCGGWVGEFQRERSEVSWQKSSILNTLVLNKLLKKQISENYVSHCCLFIC